jgi:hypothetical protein
MLVGYYCAIFLCGVPKCDPALVPVMKLFDGLADSLDSSLVFIVVGSARPEEADTVVPQLQQIMRVIKRAERRLSSKPKLLVRMGVDD